jgi:tripartite-type tricarboxylate transporter receptor subunit TctC
MNGRKKVVLMMCTLIACIAIPTLVQAQDKAFPSKGITAVIPWLPAGSTDLAGRKIQMIMKDQGVNLIIKNVPGGGSIVGITEVKNATPDGYTVGLGSGAFLAAGAIGLAPLNPSDFSNISLISEDPLVLIIKADAPFNNVKEFTDYMKANPNKVTFSSAGTNNATHFLGVELASMVNAKIQHVPYDGGAQCVTQVMGGHITAAVIKPTEAMAQLKEKQIRILAIASDQRLESLPDVPTFKESGFDLVSSQITFVIAPKNIDAAVRTRLVELFDKAVQSQEYQEFAEQQGFICPKIIFAELDSLIYIQNNTLKET